MQPFTYITFALILHLLQRCGGQVVRVSSGQLLGERVAGGGGARDYWAFRGVPYAAPPVGDLRFKAPRPVPGWNGIRNATAEGSECPQKANGVVIGSEDCLFLNVYTPSLSCTDEDRYAVIIYFHGGYFILGSGSAFKTYGPDFLVHNDVVLVLPNFRIGALGFLNMETTSIPGNAGLKDGLAALQWVQDNIVAFCGDPRRVTVMGQSAGAKMVAYLAVAERGLGLFRAAIQLSGTLNSRMGYTEQHKEHGRALAARLGAADNDEAVERTLLAAHWQNLTTEAWYFFENSDFGLATNPFVPSPEWRPVDDEPVVLTCDPDVILKQPPVPRVPTLAGVMSREGLSLTSGLLKMPQQMAKFNTNFQEYILGEILQLGKVTAADHGVRTTPDITFSRMIEEKIKIKFFGGNNASDDFTEGLANLVGDLRYVYPLYRWAGQLDTQQAPLYLYLFNVVADFNYQRIEYANDTHVSGSSHADDLGYLFRVNEIDTYLKQNIYGDGTANKTLREHTKRITDFAKNLARIDPLVLRTVSEMLQDAVGHRERLPYLYISNHFAESRVENTFGAEDRLAFWDEVMKLLLEEQDIRSASSTFRGKATIVALSLALIFGRQ